MTEDLEELKSELSNLLLHYNSEAEFKELCSKIPDYEEKHKRHVDLQNIFEKRIAEHTKEFISLKDKITPDEETALKKERETLRPDTIAQAREYLQSAYKDKFEYNQFAEAKTDVSDSLNEEEHKYSVRRRLEQAKSQCQKKPESSIPRKSKELLL